MTFENKQSILAENLKQFNKRLSLAKRQKEITVTELAMLYCEAFDDTDDVLSVLSLIGNELSASEEIIFLSELCRSPLSSKLKDILFIGSSEPTSAGAHSKISYLKNKYNDMAFDYFSRSVSNAKPDYASSFTECCENVFDGRCEFCILPIMNSSDGRLMSFYSLLDRYELKICEIIDIDNDSAPSTLRYARVGRASNEPKRRTPKMQNYIFEFSIVSEDTDFFAPLFEAAARLDAKLTCIDSLPIEYASNVQKFFLSFSIPQQNALAFRLFVSLKHPSYTPIGLYKETI